MSEYVPDTILIGKQAHIYLSNIMRKQRGCVPLSDSAYDIEWARIKNKDGKRIVGSNAYGGGDGTYFGKWWSWSVDIIKSMLDDAGFDYDEF